MLRFRFSRVDRGCVGIVVKGVYWVIAESDGKRMRKWDYSGEYEAQS